MTGGTEIKGVSIFCQADEQTKRSSDREKTILVTKRSLKTTTSFNKELRGSWGMETSPQPQKPEKNTLELPHKTKKNLSPLGSSIFFQEMRIIRLISKAGCYLQSQNLENLFLKLETLKKELQAQFPLLYSSAASGVAPRTRTSAKANRHFPYITLRHPGSLP